MTNQTEQSREQKIQQWFAMWLENRDAGIESLFSPQAVYIESWGPEYHGADQIKLWFTEWNSRGRVKTWQIQQYFHQQQQTAVFWHFHCVMKDGSEQKFDGVSLVRWTAEEQICFLKEFGCHIDRYNPYEKGPTPVFRRQNALWFD